MCEIDTYNPYLFAAAVTVIFEGVFLGTEGIEVYGFCQRRHTAAAPPLSTTARIFTWYFSLSAHVTQQTYNKTQCFCINVNFRTNTKILLIEIIKFVYTFSYNGILIYNDVDKYSFISDTQFDKILKSTPLKYMHFSISKILDIFLHFSMISSLL